MKARAVFGAVLVIAPLVGCSLLVDTGGLIGDGPGGGSIDAPIAEGGPSDAAADAPAADGDAATTCVDGVNRFCDDFDQPNPGTKWTGINNNRGELTFDGAGPASPHAFSAKLLSGPGSGSAALYKDFAGLPGNVRCSLAMKLADVPTTGETDVIELISTLANGETHHVYLARFGNAWSLAEYQDRQDGGPPLNKAAALGAQLPIGTWFNVVFDVTPAAATLTMNGIRRVLALTTPTAFKRRLVMGISYATSNVPTASLFLDSVDCTTAP